MIRNILLLATFVAGAILALSVLSLADTEEMEYGERGIFLEKDAIIAARAELPDTSAMLGEKFTATFVVQYRPEYADPIMESLDNASTDPFERQGEARIRHEDLEEGIAQYTYEVDLRAFTPLNGFTYSTERSLLYYYNEREDATESIQIDPLEGIVIGQYYGGAAQDADPRPLKGRLLDQTEFKSSLWLVVALLLLTSSITALVIAGDPKPKLTSEAFENYEAETFIAALARFSDSEWLRDSSSTAKTRMLELQDIACAIAYHVGGIPAEEFLRRDDSITKALSSAYSEKYLDYRLVEDTAKEIEKFAYSLINDTRGGGK